MTHNNKTKDLIFTVHLNQYRNFFKRFWTGIKYIFGYKCKYGQWDCFELKHSDIPEFKRILDVVEKHQKDQPSYCDINGKYFFFENKQVLIDKITSSKL